MLLTIPAAASSVVIVLALLVGVAAIAVSSGPGWRELRWFGVGALCASVYGVCALQSTLELPLAVHAFFGRLGGASASALVASWIVYFASKQRRPLASFERYLAIAVVIVAVAWMIPGLCRTSEAFVRRVPWLGVSYTTTRPTVLGKVTYGFLVAATFVFDVRVLFAFRRGDRTALTDFLAITVQLAAGVNDALAASGKVNTPYALDIGQFVVVLAAGTSIIARFIADARALERSSADLRAAQAELLRRERLAALGELSAVVAHEVRNPVTVIFNALSTLRKQPGPDESATLLEIVNEEAERLKRVVGDLLEFARPRDPSVDAVNPARLLEGAALATAAAFGSRESIAIDIEPDLPDLVADEQLLRQALINLVTNALQAPGRTSAVRVSAGGEGRPLSHVCFAIADDGHGVSPDAAAKLFTPFFTTRPSGTGLGLAIVKRIAEAHHGDVSWRPLEPHGVVFTLRIPVPRLAS